MWLYQNLCFPFINSNVKSFKDYWLIQARVYQRCVSDSVLIIRSARRLFHKKLLEKVWFEVYCDRFPQVPFFSCLWALFIEPFFWGKGGPLLMGTVELNLSLRVFDTLIFETPPSIFRFTLWWFVKLSISCKSCSWKQLIYGITGNPSWSGL